MALLLSPISLHIDADTILLQFVSKSNKGFGPTFAVWGFDHANRIASPFKYDWEVIIKWLLKITKEKTLFTNYLRFSSILQILTFSYISFDFLSYNHVMLYVNCYEVLNESLLFHYIVSLHSWNKTIVNIFMTH